MPIDYQERIPNNVELAENKTLQRALEHWQPRFLDWWKQMGPSDFLAAEIYLRTATSVVIAATSLRAAARSAAPATGRTPAPARSCGSRPWS